MRSWARANGPLLERYLAAYIESLRMAMAPENRAQLVSLISPASSRIGTLRNEPTKR